MRHMVSKESYLLTTEVIWLYSFISEILRMFAAKSKRAYKRERFCMDRAQDTGRRQPAKL